MHNAGSYEMVQPPCDKYDRWRHCVNKFELHPPNNCNM